MGWIDSLSTGFRLWREHARRVGNTARTVWALSLVLAAAGPAPAQSGTTERVSISSSGEQGNGESGTASISANGRYVAFASDASNLVPGDTNDSLDVFVRDRQLGTTERVSISSSGQQGNSESSYWAVSISADGRFAAFGSYASNLVPGDTNDSLDVFMRDRLLGTTELVSVSSSGEQGNDPSGYYDLAVSADGRFVAFASDASNLVSGDTNETRDVFVRDRLMCTTERVSVSSLGEEGNGWSDWPSISTDGRFVAFSSSADNLVPGDTNEESDVFVRDRQLGMTDLVSISSSGEQGNSDSYEPSVSANGRFVAFQSVATNLVPGDTNARSDVFVRDRQLGTTDLVSISSSGEQGNDVSYEPSISANGRFVAFDSWSDNLVPGDTNVGYDVFVRDLKLGTTERVSLSFWGEEAWFGSSYSPSVSADGRFVAFSSSADDLVPGDTNETCGVFVRDRQPQMTQRVSLSCSGDQGNSDSYNPSISADGRFVAFQSGASNLVPGDTGCIDVFLRDWLAGTTELVSFSSSGEKGNEDSFFPSVSADGRFVAFTSYASNLAPGDTNVANDVFVRDRLSGATERVSVSSSGEQGDNHSDSPSISADGRFVAFASYASDLVPGDTNVANDVFVRDRLLGTTERVSVSSTGGQGNDDSDFPSISADGRFVAFASYASDLVPGDTNVANDVFVRDRLLGTTERVSVSSTGGQGNDDSDFPSISADGRFVAFTSYASDLIPVDWNARCDVFVHDRLLGTTERVSVSAWEEEAWWGSSVNPSISADGRFVAFSSGASNLVPGDGNREEDVFLRDRQQGTTKRVSLSSLGEQANGDSYGPSVSADGRFVAFSSGASNLADGDTNGEEDVFLRGGVGYEPVCGVVRFLDLHPDATPPSTVTARVTWNGWLFGSYDVDLVPPDGSYSLWLPAGSLTLSIKHTHWLRQTMVADNSSGPVSGIDFSLVNGDCFDDNAVDLLDLTQILVHFGAVDPMADVNENGIVELGDLNVILINFGKVGDG